jgi:hypothetical protein
MREFAALECRQGIILEESLRFFLAELGRHRRIRRLQLQHACARVVGVAGHEMDQPFANPSQSLPSPVQNSPSKPTF